jgi:hypothetical protein
MGRKSYVLLVTLGALLVSMIYPSVVLKIEGMSEAAGGAGIIWLFSLLATIIASFIASVTTYNKYISSESLAYNSGLYVINIVAAPLMGILSTYLIIYLHVLIRRI